MILIQLCSLDDVVRRLGCTWNQVKKMTAHLIYWNQARLIFPVHLDNVFVLKCHPNPARITLLSDFHSKFSSIDLVAFLSQLSSRPRRLVNLLPVRNEDVKVLYLDAVTFLMRRQVITQSFTFIQLRKPSTNQVTSDDDEYGVKHIVESLVAENKALASLVNR